MPGLNWIVPCRRAVVCDSLGYDQVAREWIDALVRHRDAIVRWYEIEDTDRYDGRTDEMRGWADNFFVHRSAIPVSAVSTNTFNFRSFPFVRLWKGPLRVVLEEDSVIDPPQLNANMAVTDPDAEFLMGDVVEFPIAWFLTLCGKDAYANVRFNPSGSFLLGTALQGGSGGGRLPDLHDNLLGMMFQAILNLALAAFCHRNGPVGVGRSANGVAVGRSHRVSARGMIYGGSFGNPANDRLSDNGRYWGIVTNEWAVGSGTYGFPHNLPAPSQLGSGWNDTYLTPGWACSPFTLFLSQYLCSLFEDFENNQAVSLVMDMPGAQLANYLCARDVGAVGRSIRDADLSVLSSGSHEWALLKVWHPYALLQSRTLPRHGVVAAYDPLTGADCVEENPDPEDDTLADRSLMYRFEASARLERWRTRPMHSVFGVSTHHWRVASPSDLAPTGLRFLYTTQDGYHFADDRSVTQNIRPLVFCALESRFRHVDLYAERAVPFPTLAQAEASRRFPTIPQVRARIQTAQHTISGGSLPAGVSPPPQDFRALLGVPAATGTTP